MDGGFGGSMDVNVGCTNETVGLAGVTVSVRAVGLGFSLSRSILADDGLGAVEAGVMV